MMLGIKQGTLAELIGWAQSSISRIENMEDVDEETLAVIARALRVPVELIENFETGDIIQKIQNFYDAAQNNYEQASIGNISTTNELDVIKFALEANQKVNERIIKDKDTRINELKAENRELQIQLKNKRWGCKGLKRHLSFMKFVLAPSSSAAI